jgi:hypothetical protein
MGAGLPGRPLFSRNDGRSAEHAAQDAGMESRPGQTGARRSRCEQLVVGATDGIRGGFLSPQIPQLKLRGQAAPSPKRS